MTSGGIPYSALVGSTVATWSASPRRLWDSPGIFNAVPSQRRVLVVSGSVAFFFFARVFTFQLLLNWSQKGPNGRKVQPTGGGEGGGRGRRVGCVGGGGGGGGGCVCLCV